MIIDYPCHCRWCGKDRRDHYHPDNMIYGDDRKTKLLGIHHEEEELCHIYVLWWFPGKI